MAIPSYVGAALDEDLNTFGDWFERTNQITLDLGSKVVSAEANTTGASTTGNVAIVGVFSANTIAVGTSLRGGTVSTPAALTISSNTSFTGQLVTSSATAFTLSGNTFLISANVTTATGNTVTFNSGNTNFNGTNVNFAANTINYTGDDVIYSSNTLTFAGSNVIVSGNTLITANSVEIDNLVINDSITFSNTAQLIYDELTFSNNVVFTGDIAANTVSGNVTFTNTITALSVVANTSNANTSNANTITANTISANTITAVDFNSTSDVTLKENVETLSNSIDIINQINPVSFVWKESGKPAYGVIAQEIEKILPDIVSENDGIKTVAYTQIIAFLVAAVQEQQKEIEHIKSLL